MPLELFIMLVLLGAIVIVLLLWRWLRRWARFSLRSLVLFVMSIAAAGALLHRDISEERVLIEHGHTFNSAVAADGRSAALERPSVVRIWDATTGKHTFDMPASAHTLNWGPRSDFLIVGELTGVSVYSFSDGSLRTIPQPAIGYGSFSPNMQILLTGSIGKACLWSWPDLKSLGTLEKGTGGVSFDAAWSPDSRRVALSNPAGETPDGSTTRIYDVSSSQLLHTLPGRSPCYSPDGLVMATLRNNWIQTAPNSFSVRDVTLMLWNAADGKPCGELKGDSGIHDITFSREGGWLLAMGTEGLYAFGLSTGRCKAHFRWRRASTIGGNALSVSSMVDLPDRQGLLCLSDWDPRLYRWDYRAPWASHPFLGYTEFWILAVLGLGLLVSLIQDLRHFRKARKEAGTPYQAAVSPAGYR